MSMKKGAIISAIVKPIPSPDALHSIDVDSEIAGVEFVWRNTHFAVDDKLNAFQIIDEARCLTVASDLLEALLKQSWRTK